MEKLKPLLLLVIALIRCKSTSERVLFSSSRSGNSDIYLMNSEGKKMQQLTNNPTEEWSPVWINKNEISYLSQDNEEIAVLKYNLKTRETSKIAQPINCVLDDKNFIYTQSSNRSLYPCKGNIYMFDEDQQTTKNLTAEISGAANYIAWGNKKNEVVFTSNHEGNNEVYLLNLGTNKMLNLTNNTANDERGTISPNGKYLVFSSDRFEKGNQDILIQHLNTKEITRITKTKGTELIARWSRNNKAIYFGGNNDGNWELYRYDLKEKQTIRLTNNESFDGDPRIN